MIDFIGASDQVIDCGIVSCWRQI